MPSTSSGLLRSESSDELASEAGGCLLMEGNGEPETVPAAGGERADWR